MDDKQPNGLSAWMNYELSRFIKDIESTRNSEGCKLTRNDVVSIIGHMRSWGKEPNTDVVEILAHLFGHDSTQIEDSNLSVPSNTVRRFLGCVDMMREPTRKDRGGAGGNTNTLKPQIQPQIRSVLWIDLTDVELNNVKVHGFHKAQALLKQALMANDKESSNSYMKSALAMSMTGTRFSSAAPPILSPPGHGLNAQQVGASSSIRGDVFILPYLHMRLTEVRPKDVSQQRSSSTCGASTSSGLGTSLRGVLHRPSVAQCMSRKSTVENPRQSSGTIVLTKL